jgi:hypothetical protein
MGLSIRADTLGREAVVQNLHNSFSMGRVKKWMW